MGLQRETRNPEKDIDQSVIADFRQKSLLIRQRVSRDYLWSRIWNFYHYQVGIRLYSIDPDELEHIPSSTGTFYNPLQFFRGKAMAIRCHRFLPPPYEFGLVFHLLLDGSLKGRPVTDALGVFNDSISLGVITLSFLRLVYCNVVAVVSAASTTAVAWSRVGRLTPVSNNIWSLTTGA